MVSQAKLISKGYPSLVPGVNFFRDGMGPFNIDICCMHMNVCPQCFFPVDGIREHLYAPSAMRQGMARQHIISRLGTEDKEPVDQYLVENKLVIHVKY